MQTQTSASASQPAGSLLQDDLGKAGAAIHHISQHESPSASGERNTPLGGSALGGGRTFFRRKEGVWCGRAGQALGLVGRSNSMNPGEVTLRICPPAQLLLGQYQYPQEMA